VLHFFQDEGTQENLAAGIQASLGFRGAIELSELGFELCALALQGLQGRSLTQIDGGEFRFNDSSGGHVAFRELKISSA
jgi:hypothetical protein